MNVSNSNHWSSHYLHKKAISIIVVVLISIFFVFFFTRDISSRVAKGDRGRIAIKTLDDVRRPFLDIQEVESLLLTSDSNEKIHENFERALKNAIRLIASFKTVAAYNPDLLWRVEKLENTFEKWINYERVLIGQLARNSTHNGDLFSDAENINILSMTSRYFSLVMEYLGDAEVPIHKDIHEGSKGQFELIICSGILLFCLVCIVFFSQWFKNKELRRILEVNKQTELRLVSMANIIEESLNEIYIFDSKTLHFLKVNKGARLNLGYSMEELSGLTPPDLKPKITSEHFEKILEPLRNGEKDKIHFTTIHRRKDGSLYDVEVHIQPSIFHSNPVFVAIILDITERKQAEMVIRESEERLRAIIDNTTAVIYIKDVKGKYILVNHQFEKLFHIRKNEITGQTDYEIFPKDKAAALSDNDKKIIETRKPLEFEEYVPQDDGLHTYISIKFPLSDVEGVIYGVCGISTDITERVLAERRLLEYKEHLEQKVEERTAVLTKANVQLDKEIKERKRIETKLSEREERYRSIFEDSPISLWEEDLSDVKTYIDKLRNSGVKDFRTYFKDHAESVANCIRMIKIVDVNKTTIDLYKTKNKVELCGNLERIFTKESFSIFIGQLVAIAEGKTKFESEAITQTLIGDKTHIALRWSVVSGYEDTLSKVLVSIVDITDLKLAEKKLQENNSYLRLLQVAAVAANVATDIKAAFLPIIAQICNYTGWEIGHAYAISENNPDLLKPTEFWCLGEKKQFMDFCSVTKKTDFPRGVGLPGRVLASCKAHWITNVVKDKDFLRKKIARALNIKSGIAFPVMVGASVVAVLEFFTTMEVEPDHQFMDIMADVGIQLGIVFERNQTKSILEDNYSTQKILNDLLKLSHEENTLEELLEHAIDIILCIPWLQSKRGGFFMVQNEPEILLLKVQRNLPKGLLEACSRVQFGTCLCGQAALSGKILHSDNINDEHVMLYEGIEPYSHYNVPILLNGKTIGVLLLYFKSEHKRDDREVMFLETLSNTLSGIIKRKKMEETLLLSEKMKAMGIMTSGVAHEFNNILTVISNNAQLLNEANRNKKELTGPLSIISRMVDDGIEIVDRMYEFTDIKKDISKYISIDLNDLVKQVIGFTMPRWKEMAHAAGIIYHIDQNASKTLPAVLGNPSEIREVLLNIVNNALDAMPDGGRVSFNTWNNKDNVFVAISDTGGGMTNDVRKKIFDPFFTTKSPKGTGLGMSVAYGIIKRHGGNIVVESESGKGCTITLNLPVSKKSISTVVTPKHTGKLKAKNINILVVDDEKEICDCLSKIFVEEGQNVWIATNGTEATKLLKNEEFDLLLCDLVMPDINIRDIMKIVTRLGKKPIVGMVTGWKYNLENREIENIGVDFVVKKPFNLSTLRRDINNALTTIKM